MTFDIIVPTYNRYEQLSEFFKMNAQIEHSSARLWLVDDFSTNVDTSVIPGWDNLSFIQLEKNHGQAFARNVAIEMGDSPYIISLDDDAWFEDVDFSLFQLEKLFLNYPLAGCILFNIATPTSGYSTIPTGTILPFHVTCGCAYRRSVLKEISGFSGFLHSGAEETDLSIRIYQSGNLIYFANEIMVFHKFDPIHRSLQWYYNVRHNTTRNDLLIVLMYYPCLQVLPFIGGKFLSHLLFAVKNNVSVIPTLTYTLKGFFSFLGLAPQAINSRKPLTLFQFYEWRRLSRTNDFENPN